MAKQLCLAHRLVEYIPETLADGVLYVSQRYGTAVHKCCCGCGEEVVTPLGPTEWSIKFQRAGVTLFPSIGNWSYRCRSHYWVREGRVIWADDISQVEIEHGRARDRAAKQRHFASLNRRRALKGLMNRIHPVRWIRWFLDHLKRWP